jgi:succinoglycan biosynthesis protein ExoA
VTAATVAVDTPIRRISVMAPMLDEAAHIENLVADLAAQDWDGELELLVADGRSTDDSVERLKAAAERHGVELKVFDNPQRFVSHALNLCIADATGDLIVRVDCHSRYPADYLRRCVLAAEETGADNVGGSFIPTGRTAMERAVAVAVDSPFGGTGWTRNTGGERVDADTVPYGAFRPRAFELAGGFDETLVRNQDDEFNLRLRLAGGRIVFDPAIRVYYTPRGSLRRLFRQYYEYGRWKAPVMRKHGRPTSARSLAPGGMIGSILLLAVLALWIHTAVWLLDIELALYEAGAIAFGVVALRRRREQMRLLPRVLVVFPTVHAAHGLGMLIGWIRSFVGRRRLPVRRRRRVVPR